MEKLEENVLIFDEQSQDILFSTEMARKLFFKSSRSSQTGDNSEQINDFSLNKMDAEFEDLNLEAFQNMNINSHELRRQIYERNPKHSIIDMIENASKTDFPRGKQVYRIISQHFSQMTG